MANEQLGRMEQLLRHEGKVRAEDHVDLAMREVQILINRHPNSSEVKEMKSQLQGIKETLLPLLITRFQEELIEKAIQSVKN